MRRGLVALALALGTLPGVLLAGPPYTTDDPEPVKLNHWEFYLSATRLTDGRDRSGDAPHFEANLGAAPELQLHLILPLAYSRPEGAPTTMGFGDAELGAKLRLAKETDTAPQVGIFPLVELPTGDPARGLGSGHVRAFLPLWVQKSFGPVTTYGGGGYWINPGEGNRNWWYAGWQAQVQATPFFAPGVELYYQTASQEGRGSEAHFNVGGVLDIAEVHHLLVSVGRGIHGCDCAHAYVAYLLTLGPGS